MTSTMTTRSQDPVLVDLVDALVASVDASRVCELDRLREALEPFGAAGMFNAELRLNGWASNDGELELFEGWL